MIKWPPTIGDRKVIDKVFPALNWDAANKNAVMIAGYKWNYLDQVTVATIPFLVGNPYKL